jgi:hypothetical protein
MHAQASELDLCLIEKSKRAPTSGDTERRYRAVGAPQRSENGSRMKIKRPSSRLFMLVISMALFMTSACSPHPTKLMYEAEALLVIGTTSKPVPSDQEFAEILSKIKQVAENCVSNTPATVTVKRDRKSRFVRVHLLADSRQGAIDSCNNVCLACDSYREEQIRSRQEERLYVYSLERAEFAKPK